MVFEIFCASVNECQKWLNMNTKHSTYYHWCLLPNHLSPPDSQDDSNALKVVCTICGRDPDKLNTTSQSQPIQTNTMVISECYSDLTKCIILWLFCKLNDLPQLIPRNENFLFAIKCIIMRLLRYLLTICWPNYANVYSSIVLSMLTQKFNAQVKKIINEVLCYM